jgi:hypothetical protein
MDMIYNREFDLKADVLSIIISPVQNRYLLTMGGKNKKKKIV